MAKTKAEKEKELKEQLQKELEQQVIQIKSSADKAIKKRNLRIKRLKVVLSVVVVLFIASLAGGGLAYKNLKDENRRLGNPEESAKAETERLKSKIASLVDVPQDEEPTIATVSDASKLKDQAFFAKAENGDKVFIYNKAKKAILYRPSTDKIVELNTITDQNAAPTQQQGVNQADSSQNTQSNSQTTTPQTDQSGLAPTAP